MRPVVGLLHKVNHCLHQRPHPAMSQTNTQAEVAAETEANWRDGLAAITAEPRNEGIVRRFVRFAVALAALPPAVYFGFRYTLRNHVPAKVLQRLPPALSPTIIAGIAAVLAVNIITASFALIAVAEKPPGNTASDNASERPKDE